MRCDGFALETVLADISDIYVNFGIGPKEESKTHENIYIYIYHVEIGDGPSKLEITTDACILIVHGRWAQQTPRDSSTTRVA